MLISARKLLLRNLASFVMFFPMWAGAGELQPNIVFIMVDDLGIGELQWYPTESDISQRVPDAADIIQTPNLFQLAQEGMRFTNYRSPAPVCSPARAAILTSRYPQEFGFRDYLPNESGRGITPGTPTIASLLRDLGGYRTAHFGKWHLGSSYARHLPVSHGFDESLVRVGLELLDGYKDTVFIQDDDIAGMGVIAPGEHSAETLTNRAIQFVEMAEDSGEPYFLNLWYRAPHSPLDPPGNFPLNVSSWNNPQNASVWPQTWSELVADIPELAGLAWLEEHAVTQDAKKRAMYIATVAWLDYQIGLLLDRIDALDPEGNTLIIFTSDNGALDKPWSTGTGDVPGTWRANGSQNGGKATVFEGGNRVPLIVRWPAANLAQGARNQEFVLGYDLLPTVLEAAELSVADSNFVGVSLLDSLLGQAPVPARANPAIWERKNFNSFWGGKDTITSLDDEQHRYAVWDSTLSRKYTVERGTTPFVVPYLFDTGLFDQLDQPESMAYSLLQQEIATAVELEQDYRDWRQQVGAIPFEINHANSTAAIDANCIDISAQDDVVELQQDERLWFREGDFAFQVRVELDATPPSGGAVIAEHPGSWKFSVAPGSTAETVNLALELRGKSAEPPGYPGLPGDLLTLGGAIDCAVPCDLNLAFTVLGISDAESSARIYADGVPVAEYRGDGKDAIVFKEAYANEDAPLLIGNATTGQAAITGRIIDPRFYLLYLSPAEVVSIMSEQDELCDAGACH